MPNFTPNKSKSGLAKAATILATVLGISTGLCALNTVAAFSGSAPQVGESILIVTAWIELAAMVLSAIGLIIVGIIAIVQAIMHRSSTPFGTEDSK